jgi:hypothetical protein
LPAFILAPGIVQVRASKSISSHFGLQYFGRACSGENAKFEGASGDAFPVMK